MTQYRYEVRGFYFEEEMMVNFMCITSLCPNSYVAKMYTIGKLKGHQVSIRSITRIIE